LTFQSKGGISRKQKSADSGFFALLRDGAGTFRVALAPFASRGFEVNAVAVGTLEKDALDVGFSGQINGGSAYLKARLTLDPSARPESRIHFEGRGIGANPESADAVAVAGLHAVLRDAVRLGGRLSADLDFLIRGDWTDWEVTRRAQVAGRVSAEQCKVGGTAMARALDEWIPVPADATGSLSLSDLSVASGFLSSPRIELKLGDAAVLLRGTIDSQRNLDLVLSTTLTERIVRRLGREAQMRELVGKTVEVPVRGTLDAPQFDFRQAIEKR
jgi:hypothetical protein